MTRRIGCRAGSVARAGALVCALLALATALSPGRALGSTSLVFTGSDLSTLGLRPASAGGGSARAELGLKLAPGTLIEASAGSKRGQQLQFDAFVLGSAASAGRLLTSWRSDHHAGRLKFADGAAVYEHSARGRALVEVLWRDGVRLGLLGVTATRNTRGARSAAIGYLALADSDLKSTLPTTSWGKVLAQVGSDGSFSKQSALQAFAVVYAKLPAVQAPSGPRGTIQSGTVAAEWALHYRSRLSRAEQRVIDRELGVPALGRSADAHAADLGDPTFVEDTDIESIAETWAAYEGSQLGHPLGLKIVAGNSSEPVAAFADALPLNAKGDWGTGDPAICRIRVLAPGRAATPQFLRLALAHEVFHCFQFDLLGGRAWTPLPLWVGEGTADWVALTVDAVPYSVGGGNVSTYVTAPQTPLFERSYDAVGFFGHVQDVYGNLWSRLRSIILAGGSASAFSNAGGESIPFLNTWGSSVFHRPGTSPPWEMISPIDPSAGVQPPIGEANASLIGGGGNAVIAPPYTTSQYSVSADPGDPLLNVSIDGTARLSTLNNYTDLTDAWFCTNAGRCVCPPHTTGTIPPNRPLALPTRLGLGGDPSGGTHGTLTAYPLSVFCHPKPQQQQQQNGGNQAATGGDPHLVDFHGDLFNFQAAGEFTVLKSTTDNLEVQERQQPFPHSRAVSVNTAIAIRDGGAVVEIDSASNDGIAALVNHHRISGKSVSLAGGGTLQIVHTGIPLPPGQTPTTICQKLLPSGPGLQFCELLIEALTRGSTIAKVRWKDGTIVQVSNSLTSPNASQWAPALSAQIQVAHGRLRHLTGLIGDAGVPASQEFRARDGKIYNATDIRDGDIGSPHQAQILYHEFGPSWRLTQKESLFTYARGKSTRSYTIANFPSSRFSVSTAPVGKAQQAGALCEAAGIKNQAVARDCKYDVLATGNAAFAGGEVPLQTVATADAPTTTPSTVVLHPIDLGTGSEQPRVAHDSFSGDTYVAWLDNSSQSVDVCTVTAAAQSCNGGAGPDRLVDPAASANGSGPLYFDPQILVAPGGEVTVLAEVDGANGSAAPLYGGTGIGVVAWSSPAGAAAFGSAGQGLANGGQLLSSGVSAGDAPSGGAIALDQTHIGVYGDSYPFGSAFTDFTLSAPAPSPVPTVDQTGDFGDQLGITGSQLASVPDPSAPGQYIVVAVGGDGNAPPGCPAGSSEGTGYGVGVGTPAALQTQAAWSASYFAAISCQSAGPVLAGGGPAGGEIGLLEDEGPGLSGTGANGVYFRRFSTTTNSFGPAVLVSDETKNSLDGADGLSLSEDSSGGLYASWSDYRGEVISYSSNGGASWGAAAPVGLPEGGGDFVVAGTSGGGTELAYRSGSQEYVVPASYPQLAAAGG